MKNLLLLLFPVFIFAQSNSTKLDSIGFRHHVENILKETGQSFTFYKFKFADGTKILAYKNTSNTDKIMFFYTVNKGVFAVKSITGNLQTLFPIWRKVADPKSNQEKLSKDKSDFISGFSINQLEPEYWMIRF